MLLLKITDGANANEPQDHSEKCNKETGKIKTNKRKSKYWNIIYHKLTLHQRSAFPVEQKLQ